MEVTVDNVAVLEPVVVVGTDDVELAGVVGLGGATTVVVVVVVVLTPAVVALVGAGASVIVPLFAVDEMLLRRVKS